MVEAGGPFRGFKFGDFGSSSSPCSSLFSIRLCLLFAMDYGLTLYLYHSEEAMKHEYHEGPEAAEKFEKALTHLFRVPKSTAKNDAKLPKKAAKSRKASIARGDTQQ